MSNESTWERFFDGHAPVYMQSCFTTDTIAEVDFVLEELGIDAGGRVLDVGCGTGRHSVELAKLGYRVTGVDLSTGMLAEARKAACDAGVEVELIHSNAAEYEAKELFDGAICLCEGAFCLLGPDDSPIDRDLHILKNIHAALKPGGKFLLTALSGLRMVRSFNQADIESGKFDPIAMTESGEMECDTPEGKQTVRTRERGYVPPELALLFKVAGFGVENIWGGTAGNWGRRLPDLDEMEIMVVGRKEAW